MEALRNAGCEVLGMVAIFTYGFDVAKQNFAKQNVPLYTLASYDDLITQATEQNLISLISTEHCLSGERIRAIGKITKLIVKITNHGKC